VPTTALRLTSQELQLIARQGACLLGNLLGGYELFSVMFCFENEIQIHPSDSALVADDAEVPADDSKPLIISQDQSQDLKA
jgi:hypothetical protein